MTLEGAGHALIDVVVGELAAAERWLLLWAGLRTDPRSVSADSWTVATGDSKVEEDSTARCQLHVCVDVASYFLKNEKVPCYMDQQGFLKNLLND